MTNGSSVGNSHTGGMIMPSSGKLVKAGHGFDFTFNCKLKKGIFCFI